PRFFLRLPLDHRLGLRPRAEPLQRQALVAQPAVEALRRPILPRLAGIDQRRATSLPLRVAPRLSVVLTGTVLVGIGTFLAQAAAAGFLTGAAGIGLPLLAAGASRRARTSGG